MKAAFLNLVGAARDGALALEAKFPDIVFTSGRRDVPAQAHAMATNIVSNRHWIAATYVATPESQALQRWVDTHVMAKTVQQIAAGLAAIMETWTDEQKARLSSHFGGKAFDVQPVAAPHGEAIVAFIRTLPGLDKFLTREGGLPRWHAQFH